MEISSYDNCKVRAEEKSSSPTSEMNGVQSCPCVQAFPGIVPNGGSTKGYTKPSSSARPFCFGSLFVRLFQLLSRKFLNWETWGEM